MYSPDDLIQSINYSLPERCAICASVHILLFGKKDFNSSCNDFFAKKHIFAKSGLLINYYKCQHCGFIWSNALDQWDHKQFRKFIYNHEYGLTDTPFEYERPEKNALLLESIYEYDEINTLRILDFGGGQGQLKKILVSKGYNVESYDVFYDSLVKPTREHYDILTTFEVIEHIPHCHQQAWLREAQGYLDHSANARIILSTKLADAHTTCDNWYISPRNGHISIHTERSLRLLARQCDLQLLTISRTVHVLYKAERSNPQGNHAKRSTT